MSQDAHVFHSPSEISDSNHQYANRTGKRRKSNCRANFFQAFFVQYSKGANWLDP